MEVSAVLVVSKLILKINKKPSFIALYILTTAVWLSKAHKPTTLHPKQVPCETLTLEGLPTLQLGGC